MNLAPKHTRRRFFTSPVGWAFCAFFLIALFFLIAEHRAHLGFVVPYLPLALVGVCVVLHSYMHGLVHGRHPNDKRQDENAPHRSDHHQ